MLSSRSLVMTRRRLVTTARLETSPCPSCSRSTMMLQRAHSGAGSIMSMMTPSLLTWTLSCQRPLPWQIPSLVTTDPAPCQTALELAGQLASSQSQSVQLLWPKWRPWTTTLRTTGTFRPVELLSSQFPLPFTHKQQMICECHKFHRKRVDMGPANPPDWSEVILSHKAYFFKSRHRELKSWSSRKTVKCT